MRSQSKVLVIGGGPSGSTAATFLARNGVEVTLLERETFPRYHVGESLSLSVVRMMDLLGVSEKLDKFGFRHKDGSYYEWGKEKWDLPFTDVPGGKHSWQGHQGRLRQDPSRPCPGRGSGGVRGSPGPRHPVLRGPGGGGALAERGRRRRRDRVRLRHRRLRPGRPARQAPLRHAADARRLPQRRCLDVLEGRQGHPRRPRRRGDGVQRRGGVDLGDPPAQRDHQHRPGDRQEAVRRAVFFPRRRSGALRTGRTRPSAGAADHRRRRKGVEDTHRDRLLLRRRPVQRTGPSDLRGRPHASWTRCCPPACTWRHSAPCWRPPRCPRWWTARWPRSGH